MQHDYENRRFFLCFCVSIAVFLLLIVILIVLFLICFCSGLASVSGCFFVINCYYRYYIIFNLFCFFFAHRVSDFGLIHVRESQSVMGGGDTVPSAAWTAPEVLDDQDPSVLSDVYR